MQAFDSNVPQPRDLRDDLETSSLMRIAIFTEIVQVRFDSSILPSRNAKRDGMAAIKKDGHPVCPEGSTCFGCLCFCCCFPSRFDITDFATCGYPARLLEKVILTYPNLLSIAQANTQNHPNNHFFPYYHLSYPAEVPRVPAITINLRPR